MVLLLSIGCSNLGKVGVQESELYDISEPEESEEENETEKTTKK